MMMGDVPPAAEEQILREGLAGCGLKAAGVAMVYDEDIQGYVITIGLAAGATATQFECIESVARGNSVAFEDKELVRTFDKASYAHAKALWLAEAKETLRKRGLLDGLPKRSDFASVEQFAVAMERHCGFAAGSILKARDGDIGIQPDNIREGKEDFERLSALMAAVTYATAESGDFKMGFVGNESFAHRP